MNDDPRKLAVRWVQRLKNVLLKDLQAPNTFADRVDEILERVVTEVVEDCRAGAYSDANKNQWAIFKKRHGATVTSIERLKDTYRDAHAQLSFLADERRQADWATTWDHAKFYVYRAITALTIMGVVLLTGYLAQLWDIPLPMLRLAP